MPANGPRKRSRDSMEDQLYNLNVPPMINNVPIQGFAPQSNFPYEVQHLWDVDYILSQFVSSITNNIVILINQLVVINST